MSDAIVAKDANTLPSRHLKNKNASLAIFGIFLIMGLCT